MCVFFFQFFLFSCYYCLFLKLSLVVWTFAVFLYKVFFYNKIHGTQYYCIKKIQIKLKKNIIKWTTTTWKLKMWNTFLSCYSAKKIKYKQINGRSRDDGQYLFYSPHASGHLNGQQQLWRGKGNNILLKFLWIIIIL